MKLEIEIDCDEDEELVARTLYAYNSYPGQKPREIPWPPRNKSQLGHYIRLGKAVVAAQRALAKAG